ncbi:MAG: type I glyceraldehyde-3-phosphate dehydrogenase [Syntrophomonadaceae bacterium]|nr:type I glyceraldehyde-3-phosphate dehydrogenase [Syntrophomonadaceae bacterium]
MVLRVGINGFGRIGRLVARVIQERDDVELVAVNDIGNAKTAAHLLKYDSVHGIFNQPVEAGEDFIQVGSHRIRYFSEREPSMIPWDDEGVQIVIEATGKFTKGPQAKAHIRGGVKKVLITAPGTDVDFTMVMGVNHDKYDRDHHHIVSNASCTTNCLAPVAKVINDNFGIVKGLMTTIHSYTNDQRILDLDHRDLRRARAGALSMIPTSTGAAKAIGLVLPELSGKLNGMAIRVPTPNVSVVDLVVELEKPASAEAVNESFKIASQTTMAGILEFTDLPLVSKDFNGNPHSAVVDGPLTMAIGDNMVKVIAWYDNEWAYSYRVVDAVCHMAAQGI